MNIKWNEEIISYELYPGENSEIIEIIDKRNKFPKTSPVEFIMTYGDKRLFRTREKYTLNNDQKLIIILHDTTKVYNPTIE